MVSPSSFRAPVSITDTRNFGKEKKHCLCLALEFCNIQTAVLCPPYLPAMGVDPKSVGFSRSLLHYHLVGVGQQGQASEEMGSIYGGTGLAEGVVGIPFCGTTTVLVRTPLEIESGKIPISVFTGTLTIRGLPVPGVLHVGGMWCLQLQSLMLAMAVLGLNNIKTSLS